MIIYTATCDRCKATAPAKQDLFGGASYPDGWGTIYEKREMSLTEKPQRIQLALCNKCLVFISSLISPNVNDQCI